jgi:hypothetical protein
VIKAKQREEAQCAHSANARCVQILHGYFALGLTATRIIASDRGIASKSPKIPAQPYPRLANTHLMWRAEQSYTAS